MDIHVISGTEDLFTVFAFIWELASKVDVLHVLDGRAAVAADLATDAALVGPGPGIRELADVASQHCRDVLQVQAWKRGTCKKCWPALSLLWLVLSIWMKLGQMHWQTVLPVKCFLAVATLIHKLPAKMHSFDVILDILFGFVCLATKAAYNHSRFVTSLHVFIKNCSWA